jgi:hypothetical protein
MNKFIVDTISAYAKIGKEALSNEEKLEKRVALSNRLFSVYLDNTIDALKSSNFPIRYKKIISIIKKADSVGYALITENKDIYISGNNYYSKMNIKTAEEIKSYFFDPETHLSEEEVIFVSILLSNPGFILSASFVAHLIENKLI